jgi:hypothetical protein
MPPVIAEFGMDIVILTLCNDALVVRKPLSLLYRNPFHPGILKHAQHAKKSSPAAAQKGK